MGEMNPRGLLWAHKALMDCLERPTPAPAAVPVPAKKRSLNPALVPGSEPEQGLLIELLGTDYYRLLEPGYANAPMKARRLYPPQSTQRAVDEAILLEDQGMTEVVEAWRCQV